MRILRSKKKIQNIIDRNIVITQIYDIYFSSCIELIGFVLHTPDIWNMWKTFFNSLGMRADYYLGEMWIDFVQPSALQEN